MHGIDHLAGLFREFPGIGARQAKRFVYFLLTSEGQFIQELTEAVRSLKEDFKQCGQCFRFFNANTRENALVCTVCGEMGRNKKTLMIVEKDIDAENIEKGGIYKGQYFILGGLLSVLQKKNEFTPRFSECTRIVRKFMQEKELEEIILALSVHPEGESTTLHLQNLLKPLLEKSSIKVTVLGRGLSTGTELEYSDSETIKNAFLGRR